MQKESNMTSSGNFSVGIDIGTSKIVAVAGTKNESGKLEIAGMAKVLSRGIKRGIVYNIEEAASALGELINKLEAITGEKITSANVAYAGQHIKTLELKLKKLYPDVGVVSKHDVDSLNEEAKISGVPEGYKIVEIIPAAYVVDNEFEQNPVGSTGRKLEAWFKLLVIPELYLANLERVFNKIGIQIEGVSFSILALVDAVVPYDDKEMGVILLDFGCGTTKLAVYHNSMLVHTAVIPFGGDVITNDIREGCTILTKWAEELKVKFGEALGDFADDQKVVTLPGQNGWEPKEISFKSLAFIIQARVEEIIDSVNEQIKKTGIDDKMGAGIILTGGTANLKHIISLVKYRTGFDVRKANLVLGLNDRDRELHNPEYFTALGLLNCNTNTGSKSVVQKKKIKTDKAIAKPAIVRTR